MGREPLYYKVKKDLEQKIETGFYKNGDFIPSEPELERIYKVSRTTVRKAIDMLIDEGYMTIVRGMGTKVSPTKLNHKPAELMSFTELMKMQGMVPSVHDVRITKMLPTEDILHKLELGQSEEVWKIYRLRAADDEPITINTSYIPRDLVELDNLLLLEKKQSLYDVLEEANVAVQATEDTISAIKAPEKIAQLLGINAHDPLLQIERLAYDAKNTVIEFSTIFIRADRYKHTITLRKR